MVESSHSRQRRQPCKTNQEMSDEAADAAALTYLLTWPKCIGKCWPKYTGSGWPKCMGKGWPKCMGQGLPN